MRASLQHHRSAVRTPLQEVIPLHTPYRMHIEVTNICNFKCIFCPPYNSPKLKKLTRQNMTLALFKKIIDDVSLFPDRIKKLYCHNFGEPLINRDLPRMIAYARERNVTEQIELLTNGSLLNHKLNRELVQAGLDHICIAVEALDAKGYLKLAKYKINYEEFVDNIRDLFKNRGNCTLHIKIADISIKTKQDEAYFYDTFGDICDSIFIENIVNQDEGYAYDELRDLKARFDKGQYGEDLHEILVCPNIFFTMTVNSDGTVSPCCVDWRRELLMGDAVQQSLPEIWSGRLWRTLQVINLKGDRRLHPVCGKCNYLKYSTDPRDDIDRYAEPLLQKLDNCKA